MIAMWVWVQNPTSWMVLPPSLMEIRLVLTDPQAAPPQLEKPRLSATGATALALPYLSPAASCSHRIMW